MGSWLVDMLAAKGHEVKSIDDLSGGYRSNVNKSSTFLKMDIRSKQRVQDVMRGIDTVFHIAAYAAEGQSFFSPIAINDINITPMNNLLVAAVNSGVRRFVFTSSMAVYGDQSPPFTEDMPRMPVDPYGVGKSYCESMLEIFSKTYGLEYITLRPHNVYGPRQNLADPFRNVLGIWMNRVMRKKPPLIYGDGKQTRAFSFVEDVIPAVAKAGLLKSVKNEIINVGSDEVVTINQACEILTEVMDTKMSPVHLEERPGEVKNAYCTVDKSVRLLNYQTKYTLKQGLTKMWSWARERGPQVPTYKLPLEVTKRVPRVWLEKRI